MAQENTRVAVFGHHATAEAAVKKLADSGFDMTKLSIRMPKDSILEYETAVKADGFLLVAHGTPARSCAPAWCWRRQALRGSTYTKA